MALEVLKGISNEEKLWIFQWVQINGAALPDDFCPSFAHSTSIFLLGRLI
jgi:hypothetical protein